MAGNILGISLGTRHLKISVLKGQKITDFIETEIPDNCIVDENVIAWNALGDVLKDVCKDKKLHVRNCAMVLMDGEVYVRRLSMPVMNDKQLQVNLPYEFRDVLQDEPDKYLFDYSMIGVRYDENDKPVEMELLGAAVSKEVVAHYTDMFERAGLRLVKLSPRVIALEELLAELSAENEKGDFALLDLGSSYTRIDIFRDGVYEVTRSIDQGVNTIVQAAADVMNCDPHIAIGYLQSDKDRIQENQALINVYDNIATEVMRALNYYTYENQNNTLETLYYCGTGSAIEPFLKEIEASISLNLKPLSVFDESAADALMGSPSSVGVAIGD